MAELIVITGPPGAGKSAIAKRVADQLHPSVVVEGDVFFSFVKAGALDPWLPEANRQNEIVTRAAASASGHYVRGGYHTIYDGVVGPWFLPAFAYASRLSRFHYVVLLPSVEQCIGRVASRNHHGFQDEAATRSVHAAFAGSDIDPGHLVTDTDRDADHSARRIVEACEQGHFVYSVE